MGMILEGIVTTLAESGEVNIAPMGPLAEPDMQRLIFRPFQTSTTFRNLQRTGQGVFHVTDDVELLARAAVSRLTPLPPLQPAADVEGQILSGCCRWYAFRVETLDASGPLAHIETRVVSQGRFRDFYGFNRAKHAVLEAAILATRLHILPADEVHGELNRLLPLVEKTAGRAEVAAFQFLQNYIAEFYASASPDSERPSLH